MTKSSFQGNDTVDSEAKVLITLDLLGNRMIDLRPKTKINQIIYTSIGDYLPFPKNLLFPLVAKKKQIAAWFPTFEKGKEVMLGALPYFHVFGLSAAMNFSIFMGGVKS